MRSLFFTFSCVAALVLLSGCDKHDASQKEAIVQTKPTTETLIPEFGTFNTQITATASIQPSADGIVSIISPLSGSVEKIGVGIGDHVAKGSAVLVVRSSDVSDAHSERLSAKAANEEAKRLYGMNQELFKLGAITANDLAQSKSAVDQTGAMLQGVSQKLSYYGASSAQTLTLRSPINGVVYEIDTHLGDKVGIDTGSALVKIANPDKKTVVATVYEKDLPSFYVGKTVTIMNENMGGKPLMGKVTYVSDVLDPESKTNKIYIQPQSPIPNLHMNMFVDVTVDTERKEVYRVPKKSLLYREGKFIVYALQNGCFVPRAVTLVSDDPKDDFSLVRGLEPNMPIAIEAITLAKE